MGKHGIRKMKNGSRQEKSTGYIPSGKMDKEKGLAPIKSMEQELKKLQVLKDAHTKEESLILEEKVSDSLLLAKLLAVQIIIGDFKAIKMSFPESWMTNKDGKIYWCLTDNEHDFSFKDGNLLVDGIPINLLVEKTLEKTTGDNK
jgi:hypothetical protein